MASGKRVSEATLLINISLIATLDQLVAWYSYKEPRDTISKPEVLQSAKWSCSLSKTLV